MCSTLAFTPSDCRKARVQPSPCAYGWKRKFFFPFVENIAQMNIVNIKERSGCILLLSSTWCLNDISCRWRRERREAWKAAIFETKTKINKSSCSSCTFAIATTLSPVEIDALVQGEIFLLSFIVVSRGWFIELRLGRGGSKCADKARQNTLARIFLEIQFQQVSVEDDIAIVKTAVLTARALQLTCAFRLHVLVQK